MNSQKKLTIVDLKRMITEVRDEELLIRSKDPVGDQIKRLEAELEELYKDPIENEDIIHDFELELEDLYTARTEIRDEIDYERSQMFRDYFFVK